MQQHTVDDILASLAHVLRQMERDARSWEAKSNDWEARWRAVTAERDTARAILDATERECAELLAQIEALTQEREDARAALEDLLTGAEQMSQSHADVASKCRDALARVSSTEQKEETRLSIAERMSRYLGWAFEQKLIRPNETAELLSQVLHEWKEAHNGTS